MGRSPAAPAHTPQPPKKPRQHWLPGQMLLRIQARRSTQAIAQRRVVDEAAQGIGQRRGRHSGGTTRPQPWSTAGRADAARSDRLVLRDLCSGFWVQIWKQKL